MAGRLSGKVCIIMGSGRSMGRAASLGFKVLPGLAHAAAKGAILSMTRHMAMQGAYRRTRPAPIYSSTVE